jgi:hypothetical protein
MKTSSRIKQILSLALVSVMAATAMPTLASAAPEDQSDVVTVEVDLGDGTDIGDGCLGVSSLTVPNEVIRVTQTAQRYIGQDRPSILAILDYYGFDLNNLSGATVSPDDATGNDITSVSYDFQTPVDSDGNGQQDLDADGIPVFYTDYISADTDQNGVVDFDDEIPYELTVSYSNFVSPWFEVSFTASDCPDSDTVGVLTVARWPLMRDGDGGWEEAEAWSGWMGDFPDNTGLARLRLKTQLIGGLINLPYSVAYQPPGDFNLDTGEYLDFDYDPIAFGDYATAEMRANILLYGDSPSGRYQVQFGYQLDMSDDFWDYYYGPGIGG